MRPAVRCAVLILFFVATIRMFGGPVDGLRLVESDGVDALRSNMFLQRHDVQQLHDAAVGAGWQFDTANLRFVNDYNGILVPLVRSHGAIDTLTVEPPSEHMAGPAFLFYRGEAGRTPFLLVARTGVDVNERPYVELELPTTALRFTSIGSTFEVLEIPVVADEPTRNVAATIALRTEANALDFSTVKHCFLTALGLTDVSQLTGLIASMCSLTPGVKDILTIAEHGASCTSPGALSCGYFTAHLTQFLTCGSSSVVSCVNATQPFPDTPIANNQTLTGQAITFGNWRYYSITVPANASSLKIVTGAVGNIDLYLKYGSKPTLSTFDVRSATSSNAETCSKSNPAAGQWWIGVYGAGAATFSINAQYVVQTAFKISGLAGMSNTTVTVKRNSAIYSSVMADGLGGFSIGNLPAGTYTLTPSRSNCNFAPASRTITVGPDSTTSFVASCSTPEGYLQLNSGVSKASQAVGLNAWRYYWILVPSVMTRLDVKITGTGNADLYTKYGSLPTSSSYGCRSALSTSNETCTHTSPLGTFWIGVRGTTASNFTITATYQ